MPYLKGLIFFGVPHRGLDIEDISTILHRDSPRHRLLADIAPQAVALKTQRHKFVKILSREKVRIVSFYERQETQMLEMVSLVAETVGDEKQKANSLDRRRALSLCKVLQEVRSCPVGDFRAPSL